MPKPKATVFRGRKDDTMEFLFTDIQQENIKKTLKRGIYKELHKRDMLSSTQLNELIERNI